MDLATLIGLLAAVVIILVSIIIVGSPHIVYHALKKSAEEPRLIREADTMAMDEIAAGA